MDNYIVKFEREYFIPAVDYIMVELGDYAPIIVLGVFATFLLLIGKLCAPSAAQREADLGLDTDLSDALGPPSTTPPAASPVHQSLKPKDD